MVDILLVRDGNGHHYVYNGEKIICIEHAKHQLLIPTEPDGKWNKSRWDAALNNAPKQFKADGKSFKVLYTTKV